MGIKQIVKAKLDKNIGSKELKLSDVASDVEVVSFDIFDTLIVRDLPNPKELFRLLERKNGIQEFYEKRIKAEQKARSKKPGGEVTIEEIYRCMDGIAPQDNEAYCERELQAELEVCRANRAMLAFYNDCVKTRRVILVSDMYLPSSMMQQILEKCGIKGYEALYISGEIGCSKRSGDLYRYVIKKLGTSPKAVLHIGNDFMADYVCARRTGIMAVKIKAEKMSADQRITEPKAVLEVNVDDQNFGGVFAMVRNVIANNHSNIRLDIAAIERFDNRNNIRLLRSYGSRVFSVGANCGKLRKQLVVFAKLRKLIKTEGYECVHIHADTANKLLVSGLAGKSAGAARIIVHSHSSGIDGGHRTMKLIFHKLCRRALKYIATDFVACSDLAAKWMFPNVDAAEIKIINNGISLETFRFDSVIRKRVREELNIEDELLIGHVGRFNYQKNHEYLIEIMRSIVDRGIDAKLLLIGTGENEQAIRELAERLGLSKHVIFYGTTNRVNELMQAMDILVLPSLFEGLPVVGVEAQAAGLPVVYSDKITREAALTENVVFCPITKGTLSKWVDEISLLTDKKNNRVAASEELKKRGFDIQTTVDSFLDLYEPATERV